MKLPFLGDKTDRIWSAVSKVIERKNKGKGGYSIHSDLYKATGGDSYYAIKQSFLDRYGVEFIDGLMQLYKADKIENYNLRYTVNEYLAPNQDKVVRDEMAVKYAELIELMAESVDRDTNKHLSLTNCIDTLLPHDTTQCMLPAEIVNNILRSELFAFTRFCACPDQSLLPEAGILARLDNYKDILGDLYYDYALYTVNNLGANPSSLHLSLFMARLSEKLPADRATQMRDLLNETFAATLERALDLDDEPALVMLGEYVQRLADYGIAVENDAVSVLDTETVRLPEGAELSAMVVCFNRAANSAAKTEFVTLSRLNKRGYCDELCQADASFSISHDFKAALTEKYQESGAALAKKLMVNAPHIGFIS